MVVLIIVYIISIIIFHLYDFGEEACSIHYAKRYDGLKKNNRSKNHRNNLINEKNTRWSQEWEGVR